VRDSLSSNNTPSGGITVAVGWLSFTAENGSCLFLFFVTTMTEQKILKNDSNKRQTFVTSAMRCCGCEGDKEGKQSQYETA